MREDTLIKHYYTHLLMTTPQLSSDSEFDWCADTLLKITAMSRDI